MLLVRVEELELLPVPLRRLLAWGEVALGRELALGRILALGGILALRVLLLLHLIALNLGVTHLLLLRGRLESASHLGDQVRLLHLSAHLEVHNATAVKPKALPLVEFLKVVSELRVKLVGLMQHVGKLVVVVD